LFQMNKLGSNQFLFSFSFLAYHPLCTNEDFHSNRFDSI
jgi:hypothetical protein